MDDKKQVLDKIKIRKQKISLMINQTHILLALAENIMDQELISLYSQALAELDEQFERLEKSIREYS